MMVITKTQGKVSEEYHDDFPVALLPRGTAFTVALFGSKGKWAAVVEVCQRDYVLTQGDGCHSGGRFDSCDVETLQIGW